MSALSFVPATKPETVLITPLAISVTNLPEPESITLHRTGEPASIVPATKPETVLITPLAISPTNR